MLTRFFAWILPYHITSAFLYDSESVRQQANTTVSNQSNKYATIFSKRHSSLCRVAGQWLFSLLLRTIY